MELKDYLRAATPEERLATAKAADTSVAYLYQLAGNHSEASVATALLLEAATEAVAATTDGRLGTVPASAVTTWFERHPHIAQRLAS